MIDLEMLILEALPSVHYHYRKNLPSVTAVYLIVNSDKQFLYIGQALSLSRKFRNHLYEEWFEILQANKILWFEVKSKKELDQLEVDFIEILRPKLNITHNPSKFFAKRLREKLYLYKENVNETEFK